MSNELPTRSRAAININSSSEFLLPKLPRNLHTAHSPIEVDCPLLNQNAKAIEDKKITATKNAPSISEYEIPTNNDVLRMQSVKNSSRNAMFMTIRQNFIAWGIVLILLYMITNYNVVIYFA